MKIVSLSNVEIGQHNASEYISYHRSIYDVMKKRIDIVFPDLDDKNVRIELDDTLSTKTFKAILDNLPVEVSINKWGEELYTDRTTIAAEQEDSTKIEVNELDVAYWPEGNALYLFYGPTPISKNGKILAYSPVKIIGKIVDFSNKDDILNQIKDGTKVIIRESI
jgi:uncharacterized protein